MFLHWASLYNAAAPLPVSKFLEKYESEFFEVVDPKVSLHKLTRKGVITKDVKSNIETSNIDDAREILYDHLICHANVDTLRTYCEVAMDASGLPKLQALGRKMMEELPQGGWSNVTVLFVRAKAHVCMCSSNVHTCITC